MIALDWFYIVQQMDVAQIYADDAHATVCFFVRTQHRFITGA